MIFCSFIRNFSLCEKIGGTSETKMLNYYSIFVRFLYF